MNLISPDPPETKVTLPVFGATILALAAQVLAEYAPSVRPPSPTLVALAVAMVYGIIGYLAPHTPRATDHVVVEPGSGGMLITPLPAPGPTPP